MKIRRVFMIHSHGCSSDNVEQYDTDIIIRLKGTKEFGNTGNTIPFMKKLKKLKVFTNVKFEYKD